MRYLPLIHAALFLLVIAVEELRERRQEHRP
jgi:hypothetical protein